MKLRKLLCMMAVAVLALTACGSKDKGEDKDTQSTVEDAGQDATGTDEKDTESEAPKAASAVRLVEQGNPKKINLVDIVEDGGDDWKAWIKISTAFDPELSVYSCDMVPENTAAVVVTFKVSNMDCTEQNMYWCYQLATADGTVSLWDNTSLADQLTVTGDGTYQFVFDATKALGAPISKVESLQMVFPGLTETTATVVELVEAQAITDESEIALFTSGKLD